MNGITEHIRAKSFVVMVRVWKRVGERTRVRIWPDATLTGRIMYARRGPRIPGSENLLLSLWHLVDERTRGSG